jgi:tetratricopeptide (TPR) repeat protein/tRNA A-37 threonylcarbamoyl transferase component Bud32
MPDPADPFTTRAPNPIASRHPNGAPFEPSTDAGNFAPATDTQIEGELAGEVAGFRILGEIARGGMGIVYRADDPALNRIVAVKVLQDKYRDSPTAAARFLEEARITAQLQHPGIPPVHQVGSVPDGRPFLAMKLIRGRTLADLLKDNAWDRFQAVGVFEQICHTVAYAHDHGVIHRDLKPQNVMVGRFNEVQVMDWGLAKFRSAGTGDPNATTAATTFHDPRAAGDDLQTRAGSVLGTPAYMPPEQAIGAVDKVDERSDVFSLGAILCAVLTGKPPYVRADSESTRQLAALAKLDDAHARLAGCGADPELVALCKRCLTPDPADRPANAGEVAKAVAGLRAAADERARQAELDRVRAEGERVKAEAEAREQRKRRRVLLAAAGVIGGVLATGLGVSLWQMKRANAERDAKDDALKAESRARADEKQARDRAFAALRSMTDELMERTLAAGKGYTLTDEDRAFLSGVIAQDEAFAAIQGDEADTRAVRAEGRYRVGFMRDRLGELKEAEADYDAALDNYMRLAADFPTRPEFRQELARSHNSRAILRRATGRLKEAEADFDAALDIRQQLAADFPTRPEFRQDLAASYNNRANLRRDTGRSKEAEADYDAALDIRQQLAADFPTRPEFRQGLAGSHYSRANLRRDTGRLKEAEADYDAALEIRQQLAAAFPTRPEFRQELAGSHNGRANLRRDTGRPKDAEADYDAALIIQRQLAADFPTRPEFRRELARYHTSRAILLRRATGRLKAAEADYDAAVDIFKRLAADFPSRPEFRQELALSHNSRANLRRATGRPKEAEADYDAAVDIQKQLAADFPTRTEFHRDLAGSHNGRGNLRSASGRLKEAEADYDAALDIRQQLAADFPTRPEFRQELAGSHYNRANLRSATGRLKEAEADYDAALNIQKQLAADFPTRPEFRRDLASSYNDRANLRRDTGRLKEAEADYDAALNIQRQLAADFPTLSDIRNGLAGTCVDLAILHRQRKNLAEAKRLLLEGRPHHLAALKASPTSPSYRGFYRRHLGLLTEVHAGLLEPADAVGTAESLRELDWNPLADAYDAACMLSQCIPIVGKHDQLEDTQRKDAVRFYGDAAMKFLREAVSKGWKDAAHMKKDTDLDPLRERDDFQKLVAELDKKVEKK